MIDVSKLDVGNKVWSFCWVGPKKYMPKKLRVLSIEPGERIHLGIKGYSAYMGFHPSSKEAIKKLFYTKKECSDYLKTLERAVGKKMMQPKRINQRSKEEA